MEVTIFEYFNPENRFDAGRQMLLISIKIYTENLIFKPREVPMALPTTVQAPSL